MPIIKVENFRLESGLVLSELDLAYQTFGTLNTQKNNVVWVCHALTANTNVLDWWSGLFGENHLFDPRKYFIVCVNTPGSCYGSTGPNSPLKNKRPLLDQFPKITTRDAAQAFDEVRKTLKIDSIHLLLGASLGGQQALEWSVLQPNVFQHLALIATNARHSAYGIAFNESQRLAIEADTTYGNGNIKGGRKGLLAARSIALLSYRSYAIYEQKQSQDDDNRGEQLKAARYQKYQGEKLVRRFSPYAYMCLTKMMDSHNIARVRMSVSDVLQVITSKTIVIGITSDQLFPLSEQKLLAKSIPNSEYATITSDYGHDGFLVETSTLAGLLEDFLFNNFKKYKPTVFRAAERKHDWV